MLQATAHHLVANGREATESHQSPAVSQIACDGIGNGRCVVVFVRVAEQFRLELMPLAKGILLTAVEEVEAVSPPLPPPPWAEPSEFRSLCHAVPLLSKQGVLYRTKVALSRWYNMVPIASKGCSQVVAWQGLILRLVQWRCCVCLAVSSCFVSRGVEPSGPGGTTGHHTVEHESFVLPAESHLRQALRRLPAGGSG